MAVDHDLTGARPAGLATVAILWTLLSATIATAEFRPANKNASNRQAATNLKWRAPAAQEKAAAPSNEKELPATQPAKLAHPEAAAAAFKDEPAAEHESKMPPVSADSAPKKSVLRLTIGGSVSKGHWVTEQSATTSAAATPAADNDQDSAAAETKDPAAEKTEIANTEDKQAAPDELHSESVAEPQEIPAAELNATSAAAAKREPIAELKIIVPAETVSAPPKRERSRVERLSDAGPSPHSLSAVDSGAGSLKILKTSHEVPKIDPFGDDLPSRMSVEKVERERATLAGFQERSGSVLDDPFGDEQPRLDRLTPPAPDRMEPDELTQAPNALPYQCPTPRDYVKRLSDISTNIAAEPGEFPVECGLGDEAFRPRDWQSTLFAWKASSLCHKPLYFEDIELERYGQTCSPLFQPIISATKFYLTLPILPYMMGVEPPCECIYPLGYYRPGSCAPFIIPPVPISLRGALLEAGVWVAGVALIP